MCKEGGQSLCWLVTMPVLHIESLKPEPEGAGYGYFNLPASQDSEKERNNAQCRAPDEEPDPCPPKC